MNCTTTVVFWWVKELGGSSEWNIIWGRSWFSTWGENRPPRQLSCVQPCFGRGEENKLNHLFFAATEILSQFQVWRYASLFPCFYHGDFLEDACICYIFSKTMCLGSSDVSEAQGEQREKHQQRDKLLAMLASWQEISDPTCPPRENIE